jgi:hypothetical protein
MRLAERFEMTKRLSSVLTFSGVRRRRGPHWKRLCWFEPLKRDGRTELAVKVDEGGALVTGAQRMVGAGTNFGEIGSPICYPSADFWVEALFGAVRSRERGHPADAVRSEIHTLRKFDFDDIGDLTC